MTRSWSHLVIVLIILQSCCQYGQPQIIASADTLTLHIDQARLTIKNKNYSDSILLMFNRVVCEHCDFLPIADAVPINTSTTFTIDTRFPYDFQLFSTKLNSSLSCRIDSYRFAEHSSYVFEVWAVGPSASSCSITETGQSSYYWTPIIIGIILLLSLVFLIQAIRRFTSSRYMVRVLTNIGHERLINEGVIVTPPPAPTGDLRYDDILSTVPATSELPLVGSTRLSNNSVRITKVLPKRLRSLDTFRGFSLMVMIFVNYGGRAGRQVCLAVVWLFLDLLGGGYWFFDHSGRIWCIAIHRSKLDLLSVWNGLTLADLVFPWFTWMMGVSIVLSQRSLRAKNVRRRSIFVKICRRTFILFLLGKTNRKDHAFSVRNPADRSF